MTVRPAGPRTRSVERPGAGNAPVPPAAGPDGEVSVTDVAVAGGFAVAHAAGWTAHLVKRVVSPALLPARAAYKPPLLDERYSPGRILGGIAARGRQQRMALPPALAGLIRRLAPPVLDAVLDGIDLTRLVTQRVDLDAVARALDLDAAVARVDLAPVIDRVLTQIDVNEVAARIDVEAILDRVDLIALARYIIDGVDLPEIVRESSGSMASEGIRGIRMRTIDADERVNRIVDHVLLRRHDQRVAGRAESGTDDAPSDGRDSR